MFFKNKPGWSIALRILLVVLLVGGVYALTRGAYYKGYNSGLKTETGEISKFTEKESPLTYHHKSEYMPHKSGYMTHQGYPGGMNYPARGALPG